ARMESAVLHEHVAARVRVDAVIVRPVGVDVQAADDDVLRIGGMNGPVWPAADGEAFEQDVLAVYQTDEARSDGGFRGAEDALLDGHSRRTHAIRLLRLELLPGPPSLGISIEAARAGDRNVLAIACVDERRVVIDFDAAIADKHRRQVILRLIAEDELGAFFDPEF